MKVFNSRKQLQSSRCFKLQCETDKTHNSAVNTNFHCRTLSVVRLMCWEAQSMEDEYLPPPTQKNGRNRFLHCPCSCRRDLSSWNSLSLWKKGSERAGHQRKIPHISDAVWNFREKDMKCKKHISNLKVYGKSSQFSFISMAKYFNQCSAQLFWAYI